MELTSQNGVANSHGLATCACIVSHSIQYTWQLVRSDLHVCDVVLLESASNVLKKAVELVHHCILSLKGLGNTRGINIFVYVKEMIIYYVFLPASGIQELHCVLSVRSLLYVFECTNGIREGIDQCCCLWLSLLCDARDCNHF
ncbi:uncharacterized protein [Montipora capricornis]|uniref:uncharacterized protein isoform X2 n=1 Tax=Montipora capricornis TaxID=246305 RepID=UPI0035F1F2E3